MGKLVHTSLVEIGSGGGQKEVVKEVVKEAALNAITWRGRNNRPVPGIIPV
jgi:hypothetical protein